MKIGVTVENEDGRYWCDECHAEWSAMCGNDVPEICPYCNNIEDLDALAEILKNFKVVDKNS